MSLRTANNLEVLIHCHVDPNVHPRLHAPAVQEALRILLKADLIYRRAVVGGDQYATTDKGGFLLNYLLNVPFPIEKTEFIIPELQVL